MNIHDIPAIRGARHDSRSRGRGQQQFYTKSYNILHIYNNNYMHDLLIEHTIQLQLQDYEIMIHNFDCSR
jgi:hypothetical protein